MITAIYCRVSTAERGKEGASLQIKLEACVDKKFSYH
jgi:DNA invertase Pin-like site-specific DNA recombinase